jgi:hypothetical protein
MGVTSGGSSSLESAFGSSSLDPGFAVSSGGLQVGPLSGEQPVQYCGENMGNSSCWELIACKSISV